MKKICKKCGKTVEMCSWENYCYRCLIEQELERVQLNVKEAGPEEDPDTFSSNYVICRASTARQAAKVSEAVTSALFRRGT